MGACAVLWEIHLVVTRRTIRDNVGTHHHAGMSWECTTEISSKLFAPLTVTNGVLRPSDKSHSCKQSSEALTRTCEARRTAMRVMLRLPTRADAPLPAAATWRQDSLIVF